LLHERGGDSPSPSQVYRTGMVPFAGNASELRTSVRVPCSAGGGVGEVHPAKRSETVRMVRRRMSLIRMNWDWMKQDNKGILIV